jgi:hypothetical protein
MEWQRDERRTRPRALDSARLRFSAVNSGFTRAVVNSGFTPPEGRATAGRFSSTSTAAPPSDRAHSPRADPDAACRHACTSPPSGNVHQLTRQSTETPPGGPACCTLVPPHRLTFGTMSPEPSVGLLLVRAHLTRLREAYHLSRTRTSIPLLLAQNVHRFKLRQTTPPRPGWLRCTPPFARQEPSGPPMLTTRLMARDLKPPCPS